MSLEEVQVELAKFHQRLQNLEAGMKALENIVYKREGAKAERLPVSKILEDLEVSLRDRLEVVSENEVRAREYFHRREDWTTINKLLKENGFSWVSDGKNSHWKREG